jgi:hypothetical protein
MIRVEQELMNRIDLESISALELGLIIRGLSKGNYRQPWGEGVLYKRLEGIVSKHWKKGGLSRMDRARCVFTYSSCEDYEGREVFIKKSLLPYISSYIEKMNHGELHYVGYALLINGGEESTWVGYIKRVCGLA